PPRPGRNARRRLAGRRRGGPGGRVPLGPGGDLPRAADPLAGIGLERRHPASPGLLLDVFSGRGLERVGEPADAERMRDLGLVPGGTERLVGVRAGMAARPHVRLLRRPADVELHRGLSLSDSSRRVGAMRRRFVLGVACTATLLAFLPAAAFAAVEETIPAA